MRSAQLKLENKQLPIISHLNQKFLVFVVVVVKLDQLSKDVDCKRRPEFTLNKKEASNFGNSRKFPNEFNFFDLTLTISLSHNRIF